MNTDKLKNIFSFLKKHHHRSMQFQQGEWESMLGGCKTAEDRLKALLHGIAHTQSQPNLENLGLFWKKIHTGYTGSVEPTLTGFCKFLQTSTGKPLTDLYNGLVKHKGWGNKTAALFVKSVIQIHQSDQTQFYFFQDGRAIVENISAEEKIYLPVDEVIAAIFGLQEKSIRQRFQEINKQLHALTCGRSDEMLIWDNLWFWGFVTQKGKGADRVMEWNEPKFWAMRSHWKADVKEIETLAVEFIKLIRA